MYHGCSPVVEKIQIKTAGTFKRAVCRFEQPWRGSGKVRRRHNNGWEEDRNELVSWLTNFISWEMAHQATQDNWVGAAFPSLLTASPETHCEYSSETRQIGGPFFCMSWVVKKTAVDFIQFENSVVDGDKEKRGHRLWPSGLFSVKGANDRRGAWQLFLGSADCCWERRGLIRPGTQPAP